MRLSVVCLLPVLCFGAPSASEILEKGRKALGDVQSLKALSLMGARRVRVQTQDGPGTMSRESEMHFLLPANPIPLTREFKPGSQRNLMPRA